MTDVIQRIRDAARQSSVGAIDWADRGQSPKGYVEGMAVAFARVLCKLGNADAAAVAMAVADRGDASTDALTHYAAEFATLGMSNDAAGRDTLRHLFVLMMGLGMRESSGRYCEGRDRCADNTTADTAEAGLFQASYDAHTADPLLTPMFVAYRANPSGFVDIFKQGVTCSAKDLENFGDGDGRDFQDLAKKCPAFAAEFAALALRHRRKHWGPINARAAELKQECDDLFRQVQAIVDATDGACTDLV
jgi:hypothetical protein